MKKMRKTELTMITMVVFIMMNFVLSMSSYVFNGILDKLAVELNVTLAETGNLTSFYAYGAGIGVPVFLIIFRKFERSVLLKGMLFLNILTTLASVVAPNFGFLLVARFLMGLTGTCYGVLATSTIAALSPEEKVGSNLALLIGGSASALMVGIPLTRVLIAEFSWRMIFVVLIGMMVISLVYFIFNLPEVQNTGKPLNLKDEVAILREMNVSVTLIASLVTFMGYGAFYTFLTPYMVEMFPAIENYMSIFLAVLGACGFIGNMLGGYVCDRIGFHKSLLIATGLQTVLSFAIFLTRSSLFLNLPLIFVWMANGWFIGLQLNSGIATGVKNRSNLIISLNTSCIQLGQALGVSFMSSIISATHISCASLGNTATSLIILVILMATMRYFEIQK